MPSPLLDLARRHGLLTTAQIARWSAEGVDLDGPDLVDALAARGFLDGAEARMLLAMAEAEGAWLAPVPPAGPESTATIRRAPGAPVPDAGPESTATIRFAPAAPAPEAGPDHAATRYRAPGGVGESTAEHPTIAASPATEAGGGKRLGRFGKYVLEQELGRGGMGVVYKAWHPELQTHVALKVLLAGGFASGEEEARFRREAQVAARLRHPGVVSAHDVGVTDGKIWFAMEYVDGVSLGHVLLDPARYGFTPVPCGAHGGCALLPAAAVRCAQEIALAVQAAHDAGVVHRDLKPANVLRKPDGTLKVTDFGLAKVVGADRAGATATGTLMGTPEYMSPEQAEGRIHEVDARSDVYQVGAILYELLAGRPPYTGGTLMELVGRVAREEPAPPRRWHPRVDRDAETICLKAMARDRAKRYPSARAFADDCARWLAGEAILARRERPWEKLARWVRRHRPLAAALAVGALLLTAALALGVQKAASDREAALARTEQARLRGRALAALRREADTQVEAVLFVRRAGLPTHAAIQSFRPRLEAASREVLELDPTAAEPHWHLGRLLRALQREPEALAEQERAVATDPDFAPARYERAVLLARAYHDMLLPLHNRWRRAQGGRLAAAAGTVEASALPEPLDAATERELVAADPEVRALRAKLDADLRFLANHATPADALGEPVCTPAMLDCARGMRLADQHASDEKQQEARTLLRRAFTADPFLVEAYEALGRQEIQARDGRAAWRVYDAGLRADAGYVPFLLGRGDHAGWADLPPDAPAGPEAGFDRMEADYRRAAELWPNHAPAWQRLGRVAWYRASSRAARGEDSASCLERAMVCLSRALELDAAGWVNWYGRATAHLSAGNHLQMRGLAPLDAYARAEADLAEALKREPEEALIWRERGHVLSNRAEWLRAHGGDPRADWEESIRDASRALELNPAWAETWAARGDTRSSLAAFRSAAGEEVGTGFTDAVADLGRAIEVNGALTDAWMRRALAFRRWAIHRARTGGDADEALVRAEADAVRAAEQAPSASTWFVLGAVRELAARRALRRGDDAEPAFLRAEEALAKAVEANPRYADAWRMRGRARAGRADARTLRGEDGEALRAEAEAELAKARECGLSEGAHGKELAELEIGRGDAAAARGGDPGPAWRDADARIERALAADAGDVEALRLRGDLRERQARHAHGGDAARLWGESAEAFGRALERDPRHAETQGGRGRARLGLGDPPGALTDLEAASTADPGTAARWAKDLEAARKR